MSKLKYCKKCRGPIFNISEMDSEGNKISSVKCWNGHYYKIITNTDNSTITINEPIKEENIVAFIGFYNLNPEGDK